MAEKSSHEKWHQMVEALCIERAHFDNVRLAADFCILAGNTHQAAFDAALKNLGNWRKGQHIPHRRNFLLLTQLLLTDTNSEVRSVWERLYQEARQRSGTDPNDPNGDDTPTDMIAKAGPPINSSTTARFIHPPVIAALVASCLFGIALGFGATHALGWGPAAPVVVPGSDIEWRSSVVLRPNDSIVIHGKRGDKCGEQPPPWDVVQTELPKSELGRFADGGLGWRTSRSCGGRTPARAIVFTAATPGEENFTLYGDPIRIRVLPSEGGT